MEMKIKDNELFKEAYNDLGSECKFLYYKVSYNMLKKSNGSSLVANNVVNFLMTFNFKIIVETQIYLNENFLHLTTKVYIPIKFLLNLVLI